MYFGWEADKISEQLSLKAEAILEDTDFQILHAIPTHSYTCLVRRTFVIHVFKLFTDQQITYCPSAFCFRTV